MAGAGSARWIVQFGTRQHLATHAQSALDQDCSVRQHNGRKKLPGRDHGVGGCPSARRRAIDLRRSKDYSCCRDPHPVERFRCSAALGHRTHGRSRSRPYLPIDLRLALRVDTRPRRASTSIQHNRNPFHGGPFDLFLRSVLRGLPFALYPCLVTPRRGCSPGMSQSPHPRGGRVSPPGSGSRTPSSKSCPPLECCSGAVVRPSPIEGPQA